MVGATEVPALMGMGVRGPRACTCPRTVVLKRGNGGSGESPPGGRGPRGAKAAGCGCGRGGMGKGRARGGDAADGEAEAEAEAETAEGAAGEASGVCT